MQPPILSVSVFECVSVFLSVCVSKILWISTLDGLNSEHLNRLLACQTPAFCCLCNSISNRRHLGLRTCMLCILPSFFPTPCVWTLTTELWILALKRKENVRGDRQTHDIPVWEQLHVFNQNEGNCFPHDPFKVCFFHQTENNTILKTCKAEE